MLTMPASPSAEPDTVTGTPSGPAARPEGSDASATGAAADPSEHCVIVAGGVTTAMLAPLSLRSNTDPDELLALEQQILDLRDKVPTELHDDFTTLAHSVEAPPKGSGTFDEKRFRRAMAPVQDWLGEHCTGS
ncbi:hypothetical protein [Arthrobacter sp. B0490]|uniref:hypothetical protein n=1 Tax=Arthrobacter sp. B0490 TaxID=2058891 RepID=UPI000CE5611B|nr:hypothetical protein [Arthrobacter sp. B0490]